MQTYLVGGAVRDSLLGINTQDRDWLIVGADAETLLQQGFQPVGKDFPVFLHPETHEEYALARTERKTAKGYAGFSFYADKDVTLEQDLMRRDLTINAMAKDSHAILSTPLVGKTIYAMVFCAMCRLLLRKTLCGFYAPPVLQHVMAFKLPPKPCN